MDVLSQLLAGARARGGDFNRMQLAPPWSLRIADGAALALVTLLRGDAWILTDEGPPVAVGEGEVAVICGSAPYTVSDDPGTSPQLLIHAGGRCEPLVPAGTAHGADRGVRTHGSGADDPDDADLLISGTYQLSTDLSRPLLLALPRVLVVGADQVPAALAQLVQAEISRDEPGQQVVLDRWLDLALIATLRAWFAGPASVSPGWYQAQSDPTVGPALRLLHEQPARPWTVAELARHVGLSRAGLARRFTTLVGEPPMAYLASWRIVLAADRLTTSTDTVESIARSVGYANAFALSVAFKRLRGVSPAGYRQLGRAASAEEAAAAEA